MISQRNAVAVTYIVVMLMQQSYLSQCRPHESSKASQHEAERRKDTELTKETQIGESKVYGLIHNESENKEAVQEKEDIHSKILTVFDNVQQKIVNFFNTGAIVDKATPRDYEANPIEDYEGIRLGVVNAVDFVAKRINDALNKPKDFFKKANKKFTKSLNDLGSKIIGLE
ncbi:uncharacterized protein LOC134214243 [Armigeres subalbatus]|uniref:uncharacterized protein LOC134214243 n=1 Tax=Armigeres subalbatus TaxID=124917 RepID=UPI002ED57884